MRDNITQAIGEGDSLTKICVVGKCPAPDKPFIQIIPCYSDMDYDAVRRSCKRASSWAAKAIRVFPESHPQSNAKVVVVSNYAKLDEAAKYITTSLGGVIYGDYGAQVAANISRFSDSPTLIFFFLSGKGPCYMVADCYTLTQAKVFTDLTPAGDVVFFA